MFDYERIMPCPQNDFADIKRLFFGHDFGEFPQKRNIKSLRSPHKPIKTISFLKQKYSKIKEKNKIGECKRLDG